MALLSLMSFKNICYAFTRKQIGVLKSGGIKDEQKILDVTENFKGEDTPNIKKIIL